MNAPLSSPMHPVCIIGIILYIFTVTLDLVVYSKVIEISIGL